MQVAASRATPKRSWSDRLTPRVALGLVAFGTIGAMAAGLYLQHVVGLAPCPLCVLQRIGFIACGLIARRRRAGRAARAFAQAGCLRRRPRGTRGPGRCGLAQLPDLVPAGVDVLWPSVRVVQRGLPADRLAAEDLPGRRRLHGGRLDAARPEHSAVVDRRVRRPAGVADDCIPARARRRTADRPSPCRKRSKPPWTSCTSSPTRRYA